MLIHVLYCRCHGDVDPVMTQLSHVYLSEQCFAVLIGN